MEKKFSLSIQQWTFIVFLLALFLRLMLIPNPGFEADISFWKSWGLATLDRGIVEGIKVSNFNYPTPFAYALGVLAWIYRLFADPHNFNEFWTNTNTLFLFVAKLPSILSDFGIAAIFLWIGRTGLFVIPGSTRNPSSSKTGSRLGGRDDNRVKLYMLFAALYLLSPISLIDGAWWGQVDSLGVFIFLLAVLAALRNKPTLSGIVFMIAMMTKLQNMIYGPLFFLFIYELHGYRGLVRAASGATIGFFGLNIEFLLAHNMSRVVASLVENYDYFPWMSLNAFNLWWIVAGGKGMQVSDKLLAIGIANAKTVGLLLFSSFYLFAVLRQLREKKNILQSFLVSLIIVNAAFFLFQTESHDRYAFPLSVFLLLLAPFLATPFLFFYLLFTLLYFYNLHTALVFNYPNNGLPILSLLTQTPVTIFVSIILLLLFGGFIIAIARQTRPVVWIVPIILFISAITIKNIPLLFKKPIDLTSLSPYIYTQGYGQLMKNMPVNAYTGWREWHFLSVQYAFYRKGFGTHAASRMDFDIGGKFKRFTSDVGIDTEAGSAGSAIFEIYGDNRLLYSSEVVKRFDFPRHADVDVSGVRFLTLVTTDAGDGITDDHTDWLNPKLYP